jgi:hypothetical protein
MICANYTSSLEPVEASLVDTSSDTQLSQQLKSNPIAKQSSSSDKPTEYYLFSLFSETSESLMGTLGEERSMSSRAASPVRTFHLLVEALGLQENGRAFGEKWRELSVKYNPDTHSWKTHQCSLLEGLDEFSETWPKWGMMQNGVCWERIIAERPTSETESGFWRSPDTGQGGTSGLLKKGLNKRANGQPIQIRLVDQVNNPRFWPTPRSCSAMAATITPESAWQENRFPNLETVVGRRMWPTPQANEDAAGTPNGKMQKMLGNHPDIRGTTKEEWAGGTLNPPWVEWLMGWPVGWTDLKPLETDKFQSWQQQHGGF